MTVGVQNSAGHFFETVRRLRRRLENDARRRDVVVGRRRRVASDVAISQELDMRRRLARRQRRDFDDGRDQPVKPRLLGATVERTGGDGQTEFFIEGDAPRGVGDANRRMVDAKTGLRAATSAPPRRRRARRKAQKLQRMAFRVAELESGDTAGSCGQALRAAVGDLGPAGDGAEPSISGAHILDDNRQMLEKDVGRGGIDGIRSARRGEFEEFDDFLSERETKPPRSAGDAKQPLKRRARKTLFPDEAKPKRPLIESAKPARLERRQAESNEFADRRHAKAQDDDDGCASSSWMTISTAGASP